MILKWNSAFIMKILEFFEIYAQILIAHSCSVLKNLGCIFHAKIMMSIFYKGRL